MKNLILLLVLFTSIYPQQFNSLDGIESSNGNTILLYRLGSEGYYYNPIYKFNVQNGYEEKIMDAYSGLPRRTIADYEFFPNDSVNFMSVGEWGMNINFYIARNDREVFDPPPVVYRVDISKQNPQKVFVFGTYGLVRSWDGGFNFPIDSIPAVTNFIPIAISDFEDNVMFGINEDYKFCKNRILVDTSLVDLDQYFKMLYDINQFHIYRINKSYGVYSLNVSNNKGDENSWTKTYESDNPIYITIDSTQSGLIYMADGRSIYKSVNSGYTFIVYKSLPSKLVGIYKKPNSEILYAASKYKLYEIKVDITTIIKSIPVPDLVLAYYPLAIGNKWIYKYKLSTNIDNLHLVTTFVKSREVIGDTIAANGKLYYHLTEGNLNYLERIDTLDGKVFQYYEHPNLSENEYVVCDLIGEIGDTVITFDPSLPDYQSYMIIDSLNTFNQFGIIKTRKNFIQITDTVSRWFSLTEGLGMDFSNTTYIENLKYSEKELIGCIINGVVYGDTTITDVETITDLIPREYKLEQNYPNPFNPGTTISFQLPKSGDVTLKVFDVLGREVETLVNEQKQAGNYNVYFNASHFPSGVYFYRIKVGNFVKTKKMILLK